jgi:hypothetical protein
MSNVAANPAVLPPLCLCVVTQASLTFSTGSGKVRVHSPCGVLDSSKIAAIAANFSRQRADENCGLGCVCRSASRRMFGHCFGGLPAPGGNSLFCFGYHPSTQQSRARGPRFFAALRVTVSLEISFGKYTEEICRDPP